MSNMSFTIFQYQEKNKNISLLLSNLRSIEDFRIDRRKQYSLESILFIALCAVLAGANNFQAIEQYGKDYYSQLKLIIPLPNRVPSHDTFERIFGLLHPRYLQQALREWIESTFLPEQQQIALDGKTPKAISNLKKPVCLVNAWDVHTGVILGQIRVPKKTNEIIALPQIIDMLNAPGALISIDAIGCQKNIVEQIRSKNMDYLITLKKNQRSFYQDVRLYLLDAIESKCNDISHFETIEKGHGRLEKRECWTTNNVNWLSNRQDWPGLATIGLIERTTTKKGKTTSEIRFFISSKQEDAQFFLQAVRNHWKIENQLHWALDVVFDEDRSTARARHTPQNLSWLKSFAYSILKKFPINVGIATKRTMASRSFEFILKTLSNSIG